MENNHVFISYSDGFPVYYIASNTKIRFIGKGLQDLGDKVTLINKYYSNNNIAAPYGIEDGIEYYSLPKESCKVKSSILNTYRVIKLIQNLYLDGYNNVAYVGAGNFFLLAIIMVFSRVYGYKVALIQEEYQAGLDLPPIHKINGYLHSFCLGYFANYILPISEYLSEKCNRFKKPMLKLPICADFKTEIGTISAGSTPYFLYCASAIYYKAFNFVLDSFEEVCKYNKEVKLHLILSGKEELIKEDMKILGIRNLQGRAVIMTKLSYEELMFQYNNAIGLLIPLFEDNIGDVARFSQKISEYLSTKRPVVSTNVGEVKFYFTDGQNMLIASEAKTSLFADKMKYIIDNPKQSDSIGIEGYNLGAAKFDYRVITKDIVEFLKNN